MKRRLAVITTLLVSIVFSQTALGEERLRMATTTSTENSGLLAVLHPPFEQSNGVRVDVIAVGTGKALRLAENADVDVVFVHAPAAEKEFVDAGHGVERTAVMHNDFVVLGPADDPAAARAAGTAADALRRIAARGATFVSRGDDSGTHKKELALWKAAGLSPEGKWYLSVGQGMGAVLTIASDKNAYTFSDRGTYLAYRDKMDLVVVSEGDPALFNPYHVIAVNPARHPHVKYALAKKYIEYLTSTEGQKIIADYRVLGEPLFHPDAVGSPAERLRQAK